MDSKNATAPPTGPPPPYVGPSQPPPYSTGYQGKPDGSGYVPPPPPPIQPGFPGVAYVAVSNFGPYPVTLLCPHCAANVTTEISPSPGLLTYILSAGILMLGCWLGCCLIPCCIPECQDIEHRCPNCHKLLGVYRRL